MFFHAFKPSDFQEKDNRTISTARVLSFVSQIIIEIFLVKHQLKIQQLYFSGIELLMI